MRPTLVLGAESWQVGEEFRGWGGEAFLIINLVD